MDNFSLLKRTLNLRAAIRWLGGDVQDDFFPDPLNYLDIAAASEGLVTNSARFMLDRGLRTREILFRPKGRFLTRESIVLEPFPRIYYIALLHKLIPAFTAAVPITAYAHRVRSVVAATSGAYPFGRPVRNWLRFVNDFRRACLSPSARVVVVSDLANYYDHINIATFGERLLALADPSQVENFQVYFDALMSFLETHSSKGSGIPQNYDPSGFFSNIFLIHLDRAMMGNGFQYFRYVDDMRLVCDSEGTARRALLRLECESRKLGLFVSSAKTEVIRKKTLGFKRLLDTTDEIVFDQYEQALQSAQPTRILASIAKLFERLDYHVGPDGDERKLRAIANRLLATAQYDEFRDAILPRLQSVSLAMLSDRPDRSDTWARALSADVTPEIQRGIRMILNDSDYRVIAWQRVWLLETLLRARQLAEPDLLDDIKAIARGDECPFVRGRAVLILGRFGTTADRQWIADEFDRQPFASCHYRRAITLAIQELPSAERERAYARYLLVDETISSLLDYIRALSKPTYTRYSFPIRPFKPRKRKPFIAAADGVGLIAEESVAFAVWSDEAPY